MRPPSPALLQFEAVPFGVEALVLALLSFLVPVFLALWVMLDAKARTDHPLAWGLTVLVGGLTPFFVGAIAVTILYHCSREELGSIPPPEVSGDDVQRGEVLGEPAQEPAVTGMGPDGQARWEARADAGLRASSNEPADSEAPQTDEATGYDEATSMGEGEWSADAADAASTAAANGDQPADGDGGDPTIGGFEMADPIEGDADD